MSLSPLWTCNTPLALAPSIGELQHLCWEAELKCAQGHTGIGELGWNWTSCIMGIILSLHHKGILSFISVSKAILANKSQLCYILFTAEPPGWVKGCNAFNFPAHLTPTVVYRWGCGCRNYPFCYRYFRNELTKLFAPRLFDNSIISFPSFRTPKEINFMDHHLIVEQTTTECHIFFPPAHISALTLLLDYSNTNRVRCARNCTNEWEKMGTGKQEQPNVKQQIHTPGWW